MLHLFSFLRVCVLLAIDQMHFLFTSMIVDWFVRE
jgi:hypothetical protein